MKTIINIPEKYVQKVDFHPDTLIKVYEKPEVKQEEDMNFMFQSLKKLPTKIACRQCSSCHACR